MKTTQTHLKQLKEQFETERKPALEQQCRRLEELKSKHVTQLQLELDRSDAPEAFKKLRRNERQAHIDRVFRDYEDWLTNTQTTEGKPYLQVAAVFTGSPALDSGPGEKQ